MLPKALIAACAANPLVLIAPVAEARTVTVTFDGGCETIEPDGTGIDRIAERRNGVREGLVLFTDRNLYEYSWCGDGILLGDDGWTAGTSSAARPAGRSTSCRWASGDPMTSCVSSAAWT